jgi:hypothetical protein
MRDGLHSHRVSHTYRCKLQFIGIRVNNPVRRLYRHPHWRSDDELKCRHEAEPVRPMTCTGGIFGMTNSFQAGVRFSPVEWVTFD